ncbi:hypothetical protein OO015_13025 [Thermomicrobium sp. 4228-Ro]|uniref:hypothetical protein n=1 Tax=Thermomicrobium sp. 4228-Ro TaxID=2993937 RepID=UPI0022489662|nr:hypothetical protein [Thermomicrobium sp. 4228-Ro]MCX2728413.1 hypothetical protein [Thermomicrobium sp. 4228-Ro]
MEPGAVRTTGLTELIAALWRWGVPVVGWAEVEDGIVLLADGGATAFVPRQRLGERTDSVAWSVALQLPRRRVLDTPSSALLVPRFNERELAWLRFMRWLRERERLARAESA